MSNISIIPGKAESAARKMGDLSHTLSACAREIDAVRRSMDYKLSGKERISLRLCQVEEQILIKAKDSAFLGESLLQVVQRYQRVENDNLVRLRAEHPATSQPGNWNHILPTGWVFPVPQPAPPFPKPFPIPMFPIYIRMPPYSILPWKIDFSKVLKVLLEGRVTFRPGFISWTPPVIRPQVVISLFSSNNTNSRT